MTAPHSEPETASRQRPSSDIIATIVAFVLAAAAAVLSFSLSPLFVMAADPCDNHNCDTAAISWAYAVTWGGLGLAAVAAIGGTVFAAARRRRMWIWPTGALGLIVVTFAIGTLLAGSVLPHQ
ncbi:hypothetical protein [Mycobacterium shigaense]|uniref:Uncharacterized protein n=1 Tax=Mycobacterium shigaense TaxID=722731 RepID=A0A1Z4EEX9_9MYCO|nr:hypothetical protein [Mycobacterium shigaense]PRI16260.1 hypothetical protein B2J96_05535 [Mycobacterium shigaense]BAX91498.1 hypothetical protein MSG_01340 [Mycobacterium shigaense]